MNILHVLSVLAVAVIFTACRTGAPLPRATSAMLLDDERMGSNSFVIPVRQGTKVRPVETVAELRDNPNVSQLDIDAVQGVRAKDIRYVNSGEKLRLSETDATGNK